MLGHSSGGSLGGRARRIGTRLAPFLGVGTLGRLEFIGERGRPGSGPDIVVRGWLDPGRQRAAMSALVLSVDEQVVCDLPLVDLGPQWQQPVRSRTDWTASLPPSTIAPWSRVEAFARTGAHLSSLGVLVAGPAENAPGAGLDLTAMLDLPKPGTVVSLPACMVAGWATLDGAAPDRIEVFLGSEPARPIRRGLPRPDLPAPLRFGCGFESIVDLSAFRPGDDVSVVVRATGRAGTVWTSEPVYVHLDDDATIAADRIGAQVLEPGMTRVMPAAKVRAQPRGGRTRVVVFTHSLRLGGGQLHLQEMALRMAAAGEIELIVVAPEDGTLRRELEDAGIAVHVTRGYAVDPVNYAGQVTEFAALLQATDADVVLLNTLGLFPVVDAARQCGVPVAWAIHESFELPVFEYLNWGSAGLHPSVRGRMQAALRNADAVVFETPSTLDLFVGPIPEMNAVLVRYGVDDREIKEFIARSDRADLRAAAGIAPEDTVLICMGVFEPRKAILALVDAFADATRHLDNVRLVLIGSHPAPYCEMVEQMIESLGLRDRVWTVPITPDIYPWYHLADFMVSASDVESLPRSMLEAMTFGRPIVATDTFGTAELIEDGVNGFLCQANCHTSLVAAIGRATRLSASDRDDMGRRSAERVVELGGFDYHLEYATLLRRLAGRQLEGESVGD